MKPATPCLYILLLAVMACGQSENAGYTASSGAAAIQDQDHPVIPSCYVFCDMSGSQDSKSKQIIMQHAVDIFKKAKGYDFKYYDISAPQFEPPFFEYTEPPVPEIAKPTDLKDNDEERSHKTDSLTKRLMELYHRPSSNRTCILRTIEKAVNTLTSKSGGSAGQDVRIIILSDMLEDCNYSFGRLNIDHGVFKDAMKVLEKMPAPRFTLSKYKKAEVYLVASSQRRIATDSLYSFWVEAFKKYGYDLTSPILVQLPDWVTNPGEE